MRLVLTGAIAILWLANAGAASAQLLPPGFFDKAPLAGEGQAAVEADTLSYDATTGVITADGRVVMSQDGYNVQGESLVYNQRQGNLHLVGNVIMLAPDGTRYTSNDVEITGGMKNAVLKSLTVTTTKGSLVTAADANFVSELETILNEATYSPCGSCIDAKGRRIGWSIKAGKLVSDKRTKLVHMSDIQLAFWGFPVAWLPFLTIPDPTQPEFRALPTVKASHSDKTGHTLEIPYAVSLGPDTDVIFTAQLMSRQGALLGAEWIQRFSNGEMNTKASGVYQLDPSAFYPGIGDGQWRGAIQSSGRFVPVKHWAVGWSYTAFSDPAYLIDYRLQVKKSSVSEVYAEHLSRDYFGEVRVQQFNQLGDVTNASQAQQARALPNARLENVTDLGNGNGQVNVSTRLLGVQRDADQRTVLNGVPYVTGYEGNKVHATAQLSWQNQYIGPAGVLFSPYVGVRGDAAYYDGGATSPGAPYPDAPDQLTLLSATPIAAMDVRWPLFGAAGDVSHIVEPIAQLVYRGSSTTDVGITNDNAQSFVFDDTNLFSYDRFSGSDRQETGLRANIGARYQANLSNGSYLELIAGQSFHLAGTNALGIADAAQTGNSTGLEDTASDVVLGAKTSIVPNLIAGAKMQVDPDTLKVMRAGLGAQFGIDGYSAALSYTYIGAVPARGVLRDQNEIAASVGIPVADYWSVSTGVAWDLASNNWLEASAGLHYDDKYLLFGIDSTITGPTHTTPNDTRYTATFRIKGPDGIDVGFASESATK
jgi:LPS-assembly protein